MQLDEERELKELLLEICIFIDETLSLSEKEFILFIFLNLEISGYNNNEEHPINIPFISVTFGRDHFEISGNKDKDEHPLNR